MKLVRTIEPMDKPQNRTREIEIKTDTMPYCTKIVELARISNVPHYGFGWQTVKFVWTKDNTKSEIVRCINHLEIGGTAAMSRQLRLGDSIMFINSFSVNIMNDTIFNQTVESSVVLRLHICSDLNVKQRFLETNLQLIKIKYNRLVDEYNKLVLMSELKGNEETRSLEIEERATTVTNGDDTRTYQIHHF
ncbi:hypothetical protein ACOME3_007170 [Neoechinorhynchus agilis]